MFSSYQEKCLGKTNLDLKTSVFISSLITPIKVFMITYLLSDRI